MTRIHSLATLAFPILLFVAPQDLCAAQARKDSPAEKAEREEREALSKEAKQMAGGSEFAQQKVISGTFSILDDEKFKNGPFPKPVGALTGVNSYIIMADGEKMYNKLLPFDNKKLAVTGRIVKKGAKGIYFLVDKLGVGVEQEVGPFYRPKHGGI